MIYATARTQIKDGDLVAFQGRSLGARVTQWKTDSPWSHVGIACWWGSRLMILESYPGKGTRAHPLSHDLPCYLVPMGIDWTPELHDYATELLDLKYSWLNDWKAAWGLRLVTRAYQCAQYVAAVYSKAGIKNLPESPTPANLMAQVADRPGFWLEAA